MPSTLHYLRRPPKRRPDEGELRGLLDPLLDPNRFPLLPLLLGDFPNCCPCDPDADGLVAAPFADPELLYPPPLFAYCELP